MSHNDSYETIDKALSVNHFSYTGVPVPRFFFDTYDGDLIIPDDEGQELEGLEAAKAVAQEELPHIARDELPDGDQRTFIVSVRDEAGEVVMRATLLLAMEYPSRGSK
jgi:hypothetical protein